MNISGRSGGICEVVILFHTSESIEMIHTFESIEMI